jgi:hypothetical protein
MPPVFRWDITRPEQLGGLVKIEAPVQPAHRVDPTPGDDVVGTDCSSASTGSRLSFGRHNRALGRDDVGIACCCSRGEAVPDA